VVGNDATSVWMVDHPSIYQAAALGVTVEHLGATMWTNLAGQYVATGGAEWAATYTMQHDPANVVNAEQAAYLAAVAGVNGAGWPVYPVATVKPKDVGIVGNWIAFPASRRTITDNRLSCLAGPQDARPWQESIRWM